MDKKKVVILLAVVLGAGILLFVLINQPKKDTANNAPVDGPDANPNPGGIPGISSPAAPGTFTSVQNAGVSNPTAAVVGAPTIADVVKAVPGYGDIGIIRNSGKGGVAAYQTSQYYLYATNSYVSADSDQGKAIALQLKKNKINGIA
jgi:hypothetical protein